MATRKRTSFTYSDLDGEQHRVEVNRLTNGEYRECFGRDAVPSDPDFEQLVFSSLMPTVDGEPLPTDPDAADWETAHAVVKGAQEHFMARLLSVIPALPGAGEPDTTSASPEAAPTAS